MLKDDILKLVHQSPNENEEDLRKALQKLLNGDTSLHLEDKIRKQNILVEITEALLKASTVDHVYSIIGKALHSVAPDSVVIININDADKPYMLIHKIYPPEQSLLTKAFNLLGYNPEGKKFRQDKEAMKFFASGQLVLYPGGILNLGNNYVPGAILKQLVTLLKLNDVYLIGFSHEGKIFAGAQIYTFRDSSGLDKALIETLVKNASITLQKIHYKSYALEKANELDDFLGHLPVGVTFINEKEQIVEWNAEMEKITGYSKTEILGRNFAEFTKSIHKQPEETLKKPLKSLFESNTGSEEILNGEKYFFHKDGTSRFVIEKSYLFTGRNQQYIVIISMDITDHQKVSDELMEVGFVLEGKNKLLQRSNEAKDKLISIIGHDLRGPLGNILGLTELLITRDYSSLDKMRNFHTLLFITAESSYLLLENILAWLRSENKGLEMNVELFPLNEVIVQTQRLLQLVAEQKQIAFESELPENLIVFADRNMVTTIFRNLLSNAVKFTPQNGHVKVSVQKKDDKKILIRIMDDGKGLTKAEIASIKNLQRDSTPGTAGERGTGLGLIICQEFLKLHGADLTITSVPGEGSTFSFELATGEL